MSEIPNTKKPELEKGSEALTEDLYGLSQESPREFARKWQEERDTAELGLPELEEFFREKFVEQGGENPDLTEMSEENRRMLYSLRAAGDEFSIIYNNLADEISGNQGQSESFARFKQEQDARASQQHDRPPLPGDDFTEWILESFEGSPAESSIQGTPSVEESGDIRSRLNPNPSEPLSEATKKDFFDLSRSADQTFQEKLDRLDNEQQKEVRAYIKQSYENMKVAEMSPEDRKKYFAEQKEKLANEQAAAANEARQDALEIAVAQEPAPGEVSPEVKARRENPQTEEDYLLLHSLKLTDGVQFKDVYSKLTTEQQVKFDAREAREDAHVVTAAPDFLVPKLSRNGETWTSVSGPKSELDTAGKVVQKPDSNPLVSRGGNIVTPFNAEYQGDDAELKNLADLASSSNPEDKKAYADAVKGMPVEKLVALNKYRSENPVQAEGTLGKKYMQTMYENAHSDDPRLRSDFATASRNWSETERNQYAQYSAEIQTGLANQERQQPQAKQGPLRRWWSRLRGKK